MASLVDIARAMEKDKSTQQQQQQQQSPSASTTALSKPVLSLVDVANEQHQKSQASAPAKSLTLMDVAHKTHAAPSTNEAAVSLQSLAEDINHEERRKIDQVITNVATQVKHEHAQQRATVLQAAANEVRLEEAADEPRHPTQVAKDKESPLQLPPVRSTEPVDESGYSSFAQEEEAQATTAKATQIKPAKTRRRLAEKARDNQSDSGSKSAAAQRTTPSDSPQAKEFLRAVYRGDLRRVRDMMRDDGMDANTADQHGWSALHWAASQGHTEILSHLLDDKSALVNAVEHTSGWSPLHVAVTRNALVCVKKLLGAGADPTLRDQYSDTVLDMLKALQGKKKERLLELLDQHRHG